MGSRPSFDFATWFALVGLEGGHDVGTDIATWLGRSEGRDLERKSQPGLGFGRGNKVATLFRGRDLGRPS